MTRTSPGQERDIMGRYVKPRRTGPRPFNGQELLLIDHYATRYHEADLMKMITDSQDFPRFQRLIQEAIERKRAK